MSWKEPGDFIRDWCQDFGITLSFLAREVLLKELSDTYASRPPMIEDDEDA